MPAALPAVQVSAPLVLRDEGHQGARPAWDRETITRRSLARMNCLPRSVILGLVPPSVEAESRHQYPRSRLRSRRTFPRRRFTSSLVLSAPPRPVVAAPPPQRASPSKKPRSYHTPELGNA